jgi:aryl-alcohol dehydrogenase-like predicted oxidoreductase
MTSSPVFSKSPHAAVNMSPPNPAYDTPGVRAAVAKLEDVGHKHGISPQAVGLRWLAYHSQLGPSDGIVLSATSLEDLERQVLAIARGPLPQDVLAAVDELGMGCEKDGLAELR